MHRPIFKESRETVKDTIKDLNISFYEGQLESS